MRWDGSQHGVRCSQGLLGSWHCTVYFKEQHDFCTVLCRLSACPTARRRWQAWWCVRFCVLLCAGLRDRGGLRKQQAGCRLCGQHCGQKGSGQLLTTPTHSCLPSTSTLSQVWEGVHCAACGKTTHQHSYTQYFINTQVG